MLEKIRRDRDFEIVNLIEKSGWRIIDKSTTTIGEKTTEILKNSTKIKKSSSKVKTLTNFADFQKSRNPHFYPQQPAILLKIKILLSYHSSKMAQKPSLHFLSYTITTLHQDHIF